MTALTARTTRHSLVATTALRLQLLHSEQMYVRPPAAAVLKPQVGPDPTRLLTACGSRDGGSIINRQAGRQGSCPLTGWVVGAQKLAHLLVKQVSNEAMHPAKIMGTERPTSAATASLATGRASAHPPWTQRLG